MLKIMKERNKFLAYLSDMIKLKAGIERLFHFILILMIICHITACLWVFLAKLEDLNPHTWVKFLSQNIFFLDYEIQISRSK